MEIILFYCSKIVYTIMCDECLQRKPLCSLKTEGSFEQGVFYKKPQSMDAGPLTYLGLSFCTCSYFSLSEVWPLKETSLALCGCSEVVSRPQALFPLWAEMSGPFSQDLRSFMLFLILGPSQFLLYVFLSSFLPWCLTRIALCVSFYCGIRKLAKDYVLFR